MTGSMNCPPYKKHGFLYERPDVEVWNGELWGVIVAGAGRLLTETDIEVLKEADLKK